jgi:Zn-dependent peptidase ImmA (M78 family)
MNRSDIEKAADKLIRELGINEMPIPVEKIAVHAGCQVKAFDDDKDGVSGVFMVQNSVPVIGYNCNQSPVRQRFTIAHELGHFILHNHNDPNEVYVDHNTYPLFRDQNSSTGASIIEQQANAFAAALLMPEKLVVEEIRNINFDFTDESPALSELALKFNVSTMAMSIRLVNLHLVHGNSPNKRKTTPFRDIDF